MSQKIAFTLLSLCTLSLSLAGCSRLTKQAVSSSLKQNAPKAGKLAAGAVAVHGIEMGMDEAAAQMKKDSDGEASAEETRPVVDPDTGTSAPAVEAAHMANGEEEATLRQAVTEANVEFARSLRQGDDARLARYLDGEELRTQTRRVKELAEAGRYVVQRQLMADYKECTVSGNGLRARVTVTERWESAEFRTEDDAVVKGTAVTDCPQTVYLRRATEDAAWIVYAIQHFDTVTVEASPDPAIPAETVAAAAPAGHFPETRARYLTAAEVSLWPQEQIRLALNEIYAYRGYEFGGPESKWGAWFVRETWYTPVVGLNQEEIEQTFDPVERANKEALAEEREARKVAGRWTL